jgi:hypothetical protein
MKAPDKTNAYCFPFNPNGTQNNNLECQAVPCSRYWMACKNLEGVWTFLSNTFDLESKEHKLFSKFVDDVEKACAKHKHRNGVCRGISTDLGCIHEIDFEKFSSHADLFTIAYGLDDECHSNLEWCIQSADEICGVKWTQNGHPFCLIKFSQKDK